MYWNWVTGNWPEISALALMACGVWWLMPRTVRLPKIVGLLLAIAGADWLVYQLQCVGRVGAASICLPRLPRPRFWRPF